MTVMRPGSHTVRCAIFSAVCLQTSCMRQSASNIAFDILSVRMCVFTLFQHHLLVNVKFVHTEVHMISYTPSFTALFCASWCHRPHLRLYMATEVGWERLEFEQVQNIPIRRLNTCTTKYVALRELASTMNGTCCSGV